MLLRLLIVRRLTGYIDVEANVSSNGDTAMLTVVKYDVKLNKRKKYE
jgi:hypothetical protein